MNPVKDRLGSPNSPGNAGTPRILAVDDHRPNLMALEAILDPLGVEVVSVTSGDEALIEVLQSDFALILMDVQMPGLDGFATTAIIKKRQRSRHVPIIFLTAISRDEAHIFQGYAHGAVDYLVKPFDPAILRGKVAVFVDLWNQKQIVARQERELVKRDRDLLLQKGDARFQELADALPTLVWAVDTTGAITFANVAAKAFLGGTRRHVAELDMFHPDDAARVQEQWRAAIVSGEAFEWEARLVSPRTTASSPPPRWHRGLARRVHSDGGAQVGWIATATDVEDRKRAEQVVASVGRIAHELRAPSRAILASAEALLAGDVSAGARQAEIEGILRSVNTQAQLVDELVEVCEASHA